MDWVAQHKELVKWLGLAAGAAGVLLVALGGLGIVAGAVGTGLSVLCGLFAALTWPVTLTIAALVGGAILIIKYWDQVKAFFTGVWQGFMVAYREMLLRIGIQAAAKQNLLAYATGDNLDHLAAFYNVTRLPAQAARATLQFSVTTAKSAAVAIPAGTQVQTKDGKYSFATSAQVTLAAGSLSVTATGVATTAGIGANGYLPGEIANLVDSVDVDAVANTTTSYGGLAAEDDDRLRTRTQLATEAFSTCGPVGAYRFWALSAHQGIADVAVVSPSAGVVQVHPLMAAFDILAQTIVPGSGSLTFQYQPTGDSNWYDIADGTADKLLGLPAMRQKFDRRLQDRTEISFVLEAPDFQVESYLRYQGQKFVDRFDANSFLYVTKAADYFNLEATHGGGSAVSAFAKARCRYLVASFSSDWLYPTYQSRAMDRRL